MAYLGRVKPTETTSSVLRSTYTGNGSTTTYALPGPVANETSIIATINGVTQQDAAYSTDGSNIVFVAAPASGDEIEIRTISAVAMSYAPMAGSVVTGTIADLAVTTGKIADSSITTAKIAAGAVVQADIGTNVAGTGPAFSAYLSGNQSISNSTVTKVTFQLEEFDTASAYDNSTNYRFQPLVAGYYAITSHLFYNLGVTSIVVWNYLYKNGSLIKQFNGGGTNSAGYFTNELNALVYMNGSSDYLEVYTQQNSGSSQNLGSGGGSVSTWFTGVLARAA